VIVTEISTLIIIIMSQPSLKTGQGNNVPVPAAVGGSPTGKCGLLPQHFHHRVNAVVVLLA